MRGRIAVVVAVAALGCRPRPVAPAPPPQFLAINAPGELVDVEAALVPGLVTVVDFRADWCGACEVVDANLREAITGDARIVVRTVDVGDGATPIAGAYGIRGLPHVLIVDRAGALRYRLVGNDALTVGALARQVADEP
ncbi:MAG: thioredoxin family protein [Myxococcales bacterium]|nr:thioredoxin family protein [Myxococcales bacterium]